MASTKEARPAVFIGTGGAGTTVVAHLKRNFLQHFGDARHPQFQKLQFLAMDSSRPDYQQIQAEFGEHFLREGTEWLDLGRFNPRREFEEYRRVLRDQEEILHYHSLADWIDERAAARFFDQIVTNGASADRQQGRLCLWKKMRDFEPLLTEKIESAYDFVRLQRAGTT
jgi:tubulin-like protein